MLQFTGEGQYGSNDGSTAIKGKQMVVQVINIGNISSEQFDLLIPGGGVGQMTAGCTAQWGNVDLGQTYGGLLSECGGDCTCMKGKCESVFGSNAAVQRAHARGSVARARPRAASRWGAASSSRP